MSTRHVVLFVVCLSATALFAQTSSVGQGSLPSQPTIVPPAGSGTPGQGDGAEDQRPPDETVEQPGSPGSPTNSTPDLSENPQSLIGDSGALNLSYVGGPQIEAYGTTPSIFMQLGGATSQSSFNILNANATSVFRMGADGYGILRQDQNTITGLEINNANSGVGATASRQIRFFEGSTLVAKIASIGSASTTATGGANALQFWNFANGAMVFGTNSTERMRIAADGDITIGSYTDQNAQIFVQGTRFGGTAVRAYQFSYLNENGNLFDTGARIDAYNVPAAGVVNEKGIVGADVVAGNRGSGTITYVTGGSFVAGNVDSTNLAVVNSAYGVQVEVNKGLGAIATGYGVLIKNTQAATGYGLYQEGSDDTNVLRGKVVIGQPIVAPAVVPDPNNALNVNGNVHFSGNVTGTRITAHYQDVAEWVPAVTDLTPATVVVLNPERNNEVMASAAAYDTTVAGVVSAQPGLILGVEAPGKEQIATTGRVKVRVDASRKPVRIGDLLVTGDLPGTAMRSEPMDINGRKFHQPGTILGKALEPLEGGVSEILVLLSMQ